jgi:signal transduction histidine kinase
MTTPNNGHILVVDDEQSAREYVVNTLSTEKYHCEAASNAEQALQKLAQNSFDLAVLDISMPGKSGIELASEIMNTYPDTAVIIATIVSEIDVAIQCMKYGATDYLVKPFDSEKLVSSIASALERRRMKLAFRNYQLSLEKMVQRENEFKTEFLHSVVHDIRTPLTAIISSSEMLEENPPSDKTQKRIVNNIQRGAWSLNRRITELINLDKIQSRRLRLKYQPLEVRTVIRHLVPQILDSFQKREQQLRIELPDSLPPVRAGRDELEQILISLLSNANRFSPGGSKIVLSARHSASRVVVQVEDSAPAITDEERSKIFDLYYRGEDIERIKRIPGLGVGLFVAKKLVELLGGEIWVNSMPGKGNIFAFSLPAVSGG